MASVVFIIRVPYEENSESSKTEEESERESFNGDKEEDTSGQGDESDEKRKDSVTNTTLDDKSDSETGQAMDQNKAEQSPEKSLENEAAAEDVETLTDLDIAQVLQNELRSLNVRGDSWTVTNDKQFHQVVFLEKTGERVEKVLAKLIHVGIGKRPESSVSIIPTSVHIQLQKSEHVACKKSLKNENNQNPGTSETQPLLCEQPEKESIKDQFKRSIKSRLTVEQVVESVKGQAILTFDFVMFTILASMIAAVGLVEDNAVVLVASMLVSPLMGPILGGTFGTVIKNKNLRNTGLKTELCGLIISVVVGFLFGFVPACFGVHSASWDSTKGIWPTNEMTSRGMTRGLWVGVLIALPSGAGVALSVLGGNAGSLVGVAISASLLPPAVNSGMLWAYSIVAAFKPPEVTGNTELSTSKLNCSPFKGNSYEPMYSCDMGKEAAIMAIISFFLTVVNIICILITATAVLKIKEVTPKASSSNATQIFWTKDIKVAREAYQTFRGNQATNFLKEWRKVNRRPTIEGSRDSLQENQELLGLIEEVEKNEEFQYVVRRAPRGAQQLHKCSRGIKRLTSKDAEVNTAGKQATILENQLRNLQTYYTVYPQHSKDKYHQRHVATIFDEPGTTPGTEKGVSNVVGIETPHDTVGAVQVPIVNTHNAQKPEEKGDQVETILSEPENKPAKKSVGEFHVVETENPHHTSEVRFQAPIEDDLNTHNVQNPEEKGDQANVGTISDEPQPVQPEPRKSVREFHVVETEKPHHTSVVRVQAPTDDTKRYSVTTESGV